MERDEFLKLLGTGALAVCAACGLESCSSSDSATVPAAPINVDFTLDITMSPNTSLQNVGGSLTTKGLIIARLSSTEFIALSAACTHAGTTVNYQPSPQNFLCPNHGSKFSSTGAVINGPAAAPLHKYNAEFAGNELHVFS